MIEWAAIGAVISIMGAAVMIVMKTCPSRDMITKLDDIQHGMNTCNVGIAKINGSVNVVSARLTAHEHVDESRWQQVLTHIEKGAS